MYVPKAPSSGPKTLFSESSSFSWRLAHVCSWVTLSVHFLPVEFQRFNSLPSFYALSPSLQAGSFFCWYNIVKKPYGSPVYVMEAHINSSLCWDGQVDPQDTQNSFSETLSMYTLGLLSRVYFLNSKSPSISIYWNFFKCSYFDSFSPNIFFPQVLLSSCILL